MKPYNPNSTCVKCGHDIILSEFDDGILRKGYSMYIMMSLKDIKEARERYEKANELAHEREHQKRTCTRCQHTWKEGVAESRKLGKTYINDYSTTLCRFDGVMEGRPLEWDIPAGSHKLTIKRSGPEIHFLFERDKS